MLYLWFVHAHVRMYTTYATVRMRRFALVDLFG